LYSALLQQHEEDKIVFFFFFFSPLCRSKASSIHVYPTIPYLPCLAIAREAGPGLPCPTIAKKKTKTKRQVLSVSALACHCQREAGQALSCLSVLP
jgi:hypothetical protein